MGFDPCNCSLKIWESTGTPTPKVGVHLRVWGFIPSHFFALPVAWNVTLRLPFWPALLQALALVASPRLRLQQVTYTNYFALTPKLSKTNYEKFLKVPLNLMKHCSDSIRWEMAKSMHDIVLNSRNQRCFLEELQFISILIMKSLALTIKSWLFIHHYILQGKEHMPIL